MGRPRKDGTAVERRRAYKLASRDRQLALYHFKIELDEVGRKILTCEACGKCWHWPTAACYRDEHYVRCSGQGSWQPPASWDALPFPVAPHSPHSSPTPIPSPAPLPLRYLPWPDDSTTHDNFIE